MLRAQLVINRIPPYGQLRPNEELVRPTPKEIVLSSYGCGVLRLLCTEKPFRHANRGEMKPSHSIWRFAESLQAARLKGGCAENCSTHSRISLPALTKSAAARHSPRKSLGSAVWTPPDCRHRHVGDGARRGLWQPGRTATESPDYSSSRDDRKATTDVMIRRTYDTTIASAPPR